jgi:hypothetical protein
MDKDTIIKHVRP